MERTNYKSCKINLTRMTNDSFLVQPFNAAFNDFLDHPYFYKKIVFFIMH